jgi:CheY-like chemotaxis protein
MQILIVEDNTSIREMLTECLVEEGYNVVSSAHGQEALEELRTHRVRPNLILLDVAMPVMNGWEFLAVCQQEAGLVDIPIVMLTGSRDAPYLRQGSAAVRPVRMVAKPIDIDVLLTLVSEYQPHTAP